MDKITLPTPDQLIIFWRKGWPGYVIDSTDDYPSLLQLYCKAAQVAKEDLDTEVSQARIGLALTAIAMHCQDSDEFGKKNIRYACKAFQRVVHEMQYAKRSKKLQDKIDHFVDWYDADKRKAEYNKKLMEEARLASLKWHKENWTQELQSEYDTWKKNKGIIKVGDKSFKVFP